MIFAILRKGLGIKQMLQGLNYSIRLKLLSETQRKNSVTDWHGVLTGLILRLLRFATPWIL